MIKIKSKEDIVKVKIVNAIIDQLEKEALISQNEKS